MGKATVGKTYKSPRYKLLSFFERSRDSWREKAQSRHLSLRQLVKRMAGLEESRRKWREKAKASASCIKALKRALEQQKGGRV